MGANETVGTERGRRNLSLARAARRVTTYNHALSEVPGFSRCAWRASAMKADYATSSARSGERT